MSVRLAINPLTWTNDDMPELGAETPLETCLAEAKQAGFAGVELGNKFPRDAATLGPILARHGLALASGWYGSRLLERDVDGVPIVNERQRLVGFISRGDVLRAVVADPPLSLWR